ncbi:PKD domain-containing protein [Polaribacter sp. Hel_I_88]|uniref:PKD domain-containing protein n=1 Tax=Polaribacter sp. Hel_I_88 TaxID=1250006 RepID=UPI001E507582|nr:PKD domain-containing protein [Polaribacter sp. Hel_I_88]
MKKHIKNLKYIVLVVLVSLTSCLDDSLPNVGDLPDFTNPTPFYNVEDVSTSSFDCNDVEISANYDFNFQAGSNLAVNGTQYQWAVTPSDGVTFINKDLPILKQAIQGELATVVAIENEIAKLEFKLPCETNAARIAVLESQIAGLKADLQTANNNLSETTLQNVANLEAQIAALPAATLQDRELIFSFPKPDVYTVSLTVTDDLGKSETTEKLITVNQAVPTIAIPEIGEASFEDGSLFDGTGDGRDSWRSPSSSRWGSVFQINTDSNGRGEGNDLPDGVQAAKFPADGTRTGYQEIALTPGATYVLTYFTTFDGLNTFGDLTVAIVSTNANSLDEARLAVNTIASRTDNNVGRVDNVFKKHALTFEAGTNESAIILITNTGVESRLDAFEIIVKQ